MDFHSLSVFMVYEQGIVGLIICKWFLIDCLRAKQLKL